MYLYDEHATELADFEYAMYASSSEKNGRYDMLSEDVTEVTAMGTSISTTANCICNWQTRSLSSPGFKETDDLGCDHRHTTRIVWRCFV